MATRVLATGVFDILHPGHIFFLSEAKKLGDILVVLVTSDTIAKEHKRRAITRAEDRKKMIEALRVVDEVHIGSDTFDIDRTLKVTKPDIIALGYDQKFDKDELGKELATYNWNGQIIRIAKYPTKDHSTTNLIQMIKKLGG